MIRDDDETCQKLARVLLQTGVDLTDQAAVVMRLMFMGINPLVLRDQFTRALALAKSMEVIRGPDDGKE